MKNPAVHDDERGLDSEAHYDDLAAAVESARKKCGR